ncbi:MAG: sigma-54-dependent Fis family transcriptional regulator [Myxococcales bacterium]|nr:sigma-54-dependent Fis family transcriptional regulator [Myxococcales bacterium]MDH3484794.1 sigma-54-dependent Fis family transcriptional regulator [Myxococcales bacterium]
MPSLKWIVPRGRPRVFAIYKRVTSIGRAGANDISVDADSLEEHHAQVVFDGRDFSLSAVDPESVILVNGKKKKKSKIFHNDKLTLGDVELVFSLYDEGSSRERGDDEGSQTSELAGMMKLSDFNRRLLEIRAVPDQIEALLDAVIDVVHANKGFVILLRNGDPQIAAARNVDQETIPDAVTQLSDSILRRCIDSRQPLIVSDAVNDTMFRSSESVLNLELSSVMVAPLIAQGQLLGLIYVGNDNVVNLFEQSSLEILTVFAAQASLILQNAILLDQLTTDRDRMAEELDAQRFGDIIGSCPSLLQVFRRVEKVAVADINVLITGETGTGKELIARELHRRSNRSEKPFIVVNCGAIPENLMESELFGHVRGAFTGAVATREGSFQAADGGTLFLDEIGEMPLALQVKLLRALQEREVVKVGDTKTQSVDIRVIAATNRELEACIKEGTFREDLYYRLNVVNLHLPPLRERGDDIVILAKFLLKKYAAEFGATVKGFTPKALEAMRGYDWPGNVRQLENRLKKAIVLADKTLIGVDDLDLGGDQRRAVVPLTQAREDFTRQYILDVLERNGGNRTRTARDLGVDPRTVFRYLEREPDAPDPGGAAEG